MAFYQTNGFGESTKGQARASAIANALGKVSAMGMQKELQDLDQTNRLEINNIKTELDTFHKRGMNQYGSKSYEDVEQDPAYLKVMQRAENLPPAYRAQVRQELEAKTKSLHGDYQYQNHVAESQRKVGENIAGFVGEEGQVDRSLVNAEIDQLFEHPDLSKDQVLDHAAAAFVNSMSVDGLDVLIERPDIDEKQRGELIRLKSRAATARQQRLTFDSLQQISAWSREENHQIYTLAEQAGFTEAMTEKERSLLMDKQVDFSEKHDIGQQVISALMSGMDLRLLEGMEGSHPSKHYNKKLIRQKRDQLWATGDRQIQKLLIRTSSSSLPAAFKAKVTTLLGRPPADYQKNKNAYDEQRKQAYSDLHEFVAELGPRSMEKNFGEKMALDLQKARVYANSYGYSKAMQMLAQDMELEALSRNSLPRLKYDLRWSNRSVQPS